MNNTVIFITGLLTGIQIQLLLFKLDQFLEFFVETITKFMIKKYGSGKQNDVTNYLSVLFISLGLKFLKVIEDIEIKENLLVLEKEFDIIKSKIVKKEILLPEDVNRIEELIKR